MIPFKKLLSLTVTYYVNRGLLRMKKLLIEISQCTICKKYLPFAPKPVLQAGPEAKIIIIGQAPGLKVQQSGKPWDDASGKKLRE